MKLYFIGTGSSYPTVHRAVSSLALQLEYGAVWLFDCGEGTQIQLQKLNIARRKIIKIFITHLHGDHLFGLPGLLCTISSQIGLGANDNSKNGSKYSLPVVDLYGPLGLRQFIYSSLSLSRSPLTMRIQVHELEPTKCQYPDDWDIWPVDHSSPTALHPSEELGDVISHVKDKDGNISWNIFEDNHHCVRAGMIMHRIPSFGYIINEKDHPGTLLVDKLKSLGIPPGPCYGKLKSGISVTTADGNEVHPRDVLGPDIKGRTLVICGDTSDTSPLLHLVSDCDVLVHEATHDDTLELKAKEFGHSTPSMAANICKRMGAKTLLLNHFSQRYSNISEENDKEEESVALLLKQAKRALEGTEIAVHCTHDLFTFSIDRPKRRGDVT